MIKYLRLPVQFDTAAMLHEISQLPGVNWRMHYNTKYYEGNWSVIALRSPDGNPDNIYSLHASAGNTNRQGYPDTPLLALCPAIEETLRFFKCPTTMVRLMKLNAGAVIKEHTDYDMCFEAGEARFHIPLQTNDKVAFYIEDEQIPLQESACWYLNLNLPHRVSNGGTTDRIHLVVDCLVNNWMQDLFAQTGLLKKEYTPPDRPKYTAETRSHIIASLRLMNTPLAHEMADKMELENEQ